MGRLNETMLEPGERYDLRFTNGLTNKNSEYLRATETDLVFIGEGGTFHVPLEFRGVLTITSVEKD